MNSSLMFRTAFLLQLFLFVGSGFSQSAYTDSIRNVLKQSTEVEEKIFLYQELCWELAFGEPDSALYFGQRAVDLSLSTSDPEQIFTSYRFLGRAQAFNSRPEEAILTLESAIEKGEDYTISGREMLLAHMDLGNYYEELGQYGLAIESSLKAVDLCDKLESNGDFFKGATYVNLSGFYHVLEEYELVVDYAMKAVNLFESLEDEYYLAQALHSLGAGYEKLERFDEALVRYQRALEIFRKFEDPFGESMVLNSLGILNQHLERFDDALTFYKESYSIDTTLGDKKSTAISLSNIASIYVEMGEMELAIPLFEQAITLAKEHGELQMLMTTYKYASDAYFNAEEFERAYGYIVEYDQIRDSMISEEKVKEIMKLQEEFEVKSKEEEISLLKSEKEKIEAKSTLNYTLLFGGILVLILIMVASLLFFKNRRNKDAIERAQLEKSIVSLKSTALMAQLNPHLVFNILNSIQGLVADEQIEKANIYISKFSKFMRKSLSMSKESRIMLDQELAITEEYFELEKLRFGDRIALTIENNVGAEDLYVPPLVLQPLIENAIKHGIMPTEVEGKIKIEINERSGQIHIDVIDNGRGFQEDFISADSEGLRITEERSKVLEAKNHLEIVSKKDPTVVRLILNR